MKKNASLNIRVESDLKKDAEAIFQDLGISTSIAINLFLKQVVKSDGIPFEIKRESQEILSKKAELAELINLTGGKEIPAKFKKIVNLYARGEIDYEIAVYAIKKEYLSERSL